MRRKGHTPHDGGQGGNNRDMRRPPNSNDFRPKPQKHVTLGTEHHEYNQFRGQGTPQSFGYMGTFYGSDQPLSIMVRIFFDNFHPIYVGRNRAMNPMDEINRQRAALHAVGKELDKLRHAIASNLRFSVVDRMQVDFLLSHVMTLIPILKQVCSATQSRGISLDFADYSNINPCVQAREQVIKEICDKFAKAIGWDKLHTGDRGVPTDRSRL